MKLTLSQFIAMLSLASGKPKEESELFVKEFFSLAGEILASGDNVRIKGFGTFKIVDVSARKSVNVSTGEEYEIPGHSKVVFVASKELASIVNLPFEAFEVVELMNDSLVDVEGDDESKTEEESNSEEFEMLPEEEEPKPEDVEAASEEESKTEDEALYIVSSEDENETITPDPTGLVDTQSVEVDTQLEEEESDDKIPRKVATFVTAADDDDDIHHGKREKRHSRRRHKFVWGFFSGFIACVSLVMIAYFVFTFILEYKETEKRQMAYIKQSSMQREAADSIEGSKSNVNVNNEEPQPKNEEEKNIIEEKEEAPTVPSDSPVYDVVTQTRYLTTLAKEHYGNVEFWPYIYEENKAKLGDPDRIRPGTKVVVPSLSKYGVSVNNPADVAAAKKKGIEIYSRFR